MSTQPHTYLLNSLMNLSFFDGLFVHALWYLQVGLGTVFFLKTWRRRTKTDKRIQDYLGMQSRASAHQSLGFPTLIGSSEAPKWSGGFSSCNCLNETFCVPIILIHQTGFKYGFHLPSLQDWSAWSIQCAKVVGGRIIIIIITIIIIIIIIIFIIFFIVIIVNTQQAFTRRSYGQRACRRQWNKKSDIGLLTFYSHDSLCHGFEHHHFSSRIPQVLCHIRHGYIFILHINLAGMT